MRITAARPVTLPPKGSTPTVRMPAERVTGRSVESGFTLDAARTSGVKSPTSDESIVARTDSTSVRPMIVAAPIRPG
jgi:hypothetical protein